VITHPPHAASHQVLFMRAPHAALWRLERP